MTTYRKFDWHRATKDFSTQFTDFHGYTAADWVVTAGGAGTAALATGANGVGGQLLLTNAGADNNYVALQYAGGAGAVRPEYQLTIGKKLSFVTRINLSNALQTDYIAGLHNVATDPIGTPPTDGVYFRKLDDTARLFLVARKASAEVTTDTGIDIIAATNYDLEWYYDGTHDKIEAYVNGVGVGAISNLSTSAPTTQLALSFLVQNGDANARTGLVDYIGASLQR